MIRADRLDRSARMVIALRLLEVSANSLGRIETRYDE